LDFGSFEESNHLAGVDALIDRLFIYKNPLLVHRKDHRGTDYEKGEKGGQELIHGLLAVRMICVIHHRTVEQHKEKTPNVEEFLFIDFSLRHSASPYVFLRRRF